MDRIAELANVSKRTIYNHFGSKDALFRAVVEQLIERAKALKNIEWDPTQSLAAQLHEFIRAKLVVARDPAWSGLLRVVLGVVIRNPTLLEQTTLHAVQGDDSLVTWLRRATDAGHMAAPEPIVAANVFRAMVMGGLFWPDVFGLPMTDDDKARMADELIETFLNRYRT